MSTCFSCGHHFDAATGLEGAFTPNAGDASICIRCGGLAVFTGEGLEIRAATDDELVAFNSHPQIRRARRLIVQFNREVGR